MTTRPPRIIETPRLTLRPPALDDAEAIYTRYSRDPEVTRYLAWLPHESIETTREFLRRAIASWDKADAFPWVIERKPDALLVGMIELRPEGHRANLGYVLAREHWGQGFATEAVRSLVEWSLSRPEIFRVWAVCDSENAASARVLEKAGMQREGLLRRWMVHPNTADVPRDFWCYAKVR